MENLLKAFNEIKQKKLSIDLTRGKPHSDQLDLSNDLMTTPVNPIGENNVDLRNYGEPIGIIEARRLGADILDSKVDLTIAGEQSSYLLMTQLLLGRYLFGLDDDPWKNDKEPAFLCAVPGFDRHFATLEGLGLRMHTVNLCSSGIDLDDLNKKLSKYQNIKGLICVPKHSNPSGEIYSDSNLKQMFEIGSNYSNKFLFLFDHAYLIHDFLPTPQQKPIWEIVTESNVQDQTVITTSFSKVTFGGGGISFMATSGHSLDLIKKVRTTMIICPDKLNQKRHVEFFKDVATVKSHMQKHAELVRPKFELAYEYLEKLPEECGNFSRPTGGYFITYSTSKPIATKVVDLCKDMGVLITPAGSTFPKNYDPKDSVIRIAPTYVTKDELADAMNVFVTAIEIAHFDIEI